MKRVELDKNQPDAPGFGNPGAAGLKFLVDGEVVTQLGDPYCNGGNYAANASSADDTEYLITWPITNPDCEDESESCDWDEFIIYKIS